MLLKNQDLEGVNAREKSHILAKLINSIISHVFNS